jgi:BirA family biotin operon repressor/biotin-[acetyl-CoA-carboxylase] ligase
MSNTNQRCRINKDKILTYLMDFSAFDCNENITVLPRLASTNDYLADNYKDKFEPFKFVIAEEQTAGRGSNGRNWSSPHDTGIWLSFTWQTDINTSVIPAAIAVTTLNNLEKLIGNNKLKVKWPNDIYYKNNKVAGILIESHTSNELNNLIIGVGINIYPYSHPIQQKNTSIYEIGNNILDRNKIIATYIKDIYKVLSTIEEQKEKIIKSWNENDLYKDTEITIKTGNKYYTGKNLGLNNDCTLQILTKNNVVKIHHGRITTKKLERI